MAANGSPKCAIYVKNANKFYGQKKVLNDICVQVPQGCIYGLLGASGSGKTTLLSCLVGLKEVDSGDVYVLGGKPGTPLCGIPGPAVGYMPQDIALVAEFTVRETIFYFGRIYNMDDVLIEERFEALKLLLDLPSDDRQLKKCSGGEQRRVSFAAAMVHGPQLLILDEPTVGLDPVLRDNIWNHFIDITEKEQTTIIITTHYIEEARKAHRVGLMREGELLAEESPERLLQVFNTDSLEEVFLMLTKRQQEGQLNNQFQGRAICDFRTLAPIQKMQRNNNSNMLHLNRLHLKSLMFKNSKQFVRNSGTMAFTLILPILGMLTFLTAVGKDPHNLQLAIVNDDAPFRRCINYTKNGTAVPDGFGNCQFTNLACRFLNEINNSLFDMEYYDNLQDAFEGVRHGEVVGVLHMAQNFSDAYSNRVNVGHEVSSVDLDFGEIKVWLDMSNRQICDLVKKRLFGLFQDFQMVAFKDCNYFNILGRVPMRFTFEFGIEDEEYANFMLPGVLLTMIFFLGSALTTTIIVTERQKGVWNRCIVAGVTTLEIVVTHLATQFVLVLMQTCELIILTFVIYERDYVGNIYLIFLFTIAQGLVGMVYGFSISVISNDLYSASIICGGLYIPMVNMCGLIWPLEGQPASLRYISECLPFTLPIISLQQVIKKGYNLEESQVWCGLCITILWILGLSVISVFAINARR